MSLVIIGAGDHAAVIADAVDSRGESIRGYVAPEPSARMSAYGKYLGADKEFLGSAQELGCYGLIFGLGFSDQKSGDRLQNKSELYAPLHDKFVSVTHPSAVISTSCLVDSGVFIAGNSFVGPNSHIAFGAVINSSASVDHDCIVGQFSHIAPGATLSGRVNISSNCLVGAGSSIKNGISVTKGCLIGAGAAVVSDLTQPGVYLGVPGRRVA